MTSLPLTPEQIEALRALALAATPGEWRSMRDGNQYIQGELVGASRVAGIARPWNSQYVVPAEQLEEVCRFTDADADYIAAAQPRHILALLTELLSTRTRLEEALAELAASNAVIAERDAEDERYVAAEDDLIKLLEQCQVAEHRADTLAAENARLKAIERAARKFVGTSGATIEWYDEAEAELEVALAALSSEEQTS